MFTSLRTRLWLSYALLIAVALAVVSVVLLSFLLTNPLLYRQVNFRINQLQVSLLERQDQWSNLRPEQLVRWSERLNEMPLIQENNLRVLIFDRRQTLIFDSQSELAALALPRLPRLRLTGVERDAQGSPWLYSIEPLHNGHWFMIAAPRPPVPAAAILSDELFAPIMRAGIVALLFSLVLAYVLARWVADPLQQLVHASHKAPQVDPATLPEGGPREVQDLVYAYKEMLTRVQNGQQAQRDFVANVSHEMKTPLTSIQGFAQAILDGTAQSPAEQHQAAAVIYDEAGRMHRMVVDLLDLARIDAGTAQFTFRPLDLAALLHTLEEKFALQARQNGVTLRVQTTDLPGISADGDRLAQVLTNLIDNALRHTPAGGGVNISTQLEADVVNVIVQDTGEGIPQNALAHIFERFYQVDPSRSGSKDHGAGLGLAIAHEIALAHGGAIDATSEPGKGSTFTLRLPRVPGNSSWKPPKTFTKPVRTDTISLQ
ncbi:MAG: sensor histidine kinase [Chloroflexota bacterium]